MSAKLTPPLPPPPPPLPNENPQPQPAWYFVGTLDGVGSMPARLDPTLWAVASQPVLFSAARCRTLHCVQALAAGAGVGFTPGLALRPAIWADSVCNGLQLLQQRWAAAVAPSLSGHRRHREEGAGNGAPTAAAEGPSQPRRSPRERAQQRQLLEQEQPTARLGSGRGVWWHELDSTLAPEQPRRRRGPARAAVDATSRPAVQTRRVADGSAVVWEAVWRRLRRTPAPREHRFLAWQVMHGSLPCAAWLAYVGSLAGTGWGGSGGPLCLAPECSASGASESLLHVFLECPGAAAVAGWVSRLWGEVVRGPGPPCVPQVFLAGDYEVWCPGRGQLSVLWEILRLAFIFFVWRARCACRARGAALQPGRVAARIVAYLQLRMRQDFLRTGEHSAAFAALSGHWVPSRQPLRQDIVQARWCFNNVLACQEGDGTGPFVVRLGFAHPVPLP